MKVLVVGGGTSGLISAIILKRYLNITVDLVHSPTIGIIGVGEGSTEHFNQFMIFTGLDHKTILKECGAVYKAGTYFKNWGNTYMHSTGAPFNNKIAQYNYVYAKQISEKSNYVSNKWTEQNLIDESFLTDWADKSPFSQYHFDTFKLNAFLVSLAKKFGVNVYEDDIESVKISSNGSIQKVIGKKQEYSYDFYVDSTGFKRLLIGELGAKWESYKDYLLMDSAITFLSEPEEEYNLWTTAEALSSGWRFKIPTQERCGNGYIYSSQFIDEESARIELEQVCGTPVKIGRSFSFDPGRVDRAWINNCVAVGLSASFIEPLEASAIATSIQQSFLLMHRLINYNDKTINIYNKAVQDITSNTLDFTALHYITNRKDTKFWRATKDMPLPPTLSEKLSMWRTKLPIREDFNSNTDYLLFLEDHHTMVMHGLGLFDVESIKKEYESLPTNVKEHANTLILNRKNLEKYGKAISHKKFIERII
jgi:tryptophan halogenase